jgi:hypothetical protein
LACNRFRLGCIWKIAAMSFYLHDGVQEFRIDVRDELEAGGVEQLEHAWTTVQSVLGGKQLRVDVSRVSSYDGAGLGLLARMRESGATLEARQPMESAELGRVLGVMAQTRGMLAPWWKRRRRTDESASSGLDCLARR